MEWVKQLAQYAGPIALAAFAGTFLGGLALSFFWKNFGPWKLLEAAKAECAACHADREKEHQKQAETDAKLADVVARYEVLHGAMSAAGLGIKLAPTGPGPQDGKQGAI